MTKSVLVLHIGGGGVGLISGAVAGLARKGGRLHRFAGKVFVVAMLVMAGIGAAVAPLIHERASIVAGILTGYLVLTGWMTVRRKAGEIGLFEVVAMLVPLGAVVAGLLFVQMATASPTGTLDGQPPQANYLFVVIGGIAAASDLNMILRRGLSGAQRIARHLWRMCLALFIAAGSFFLGQPQVFPEPLRGSPVLFVPALAPLVLMVAWLLWVWFSRAFKPSPA